MCLSVHSHKLSKGLLTLSQRLSCANPRRWGHARSRLSLYPNPLKQQKCVPDHRYIHLHSSKMCKKMDGQSWNSCDPCNLSKKGSKSDKSWSTSRPTTWSPSVPVDSSCSKSSSARDRLRNPCPPPKPCLEATRGGTCCEPDPCAGAKPPGDCPKPNAPSASSFTPPSGPGDKPPCPPSCPQPNPCAPKACRELPRDPCPCPEPYPCFDEEAYKKFRFWQLIFFFGCLPLLFVSGGIIMTRHEEESHRPRPEYVPYEYRNRRTKRFPWGDGNHSFFHNPVLTPLPDGYEAPDPNAPPEEFDESSEE